MITTTTKRVHVCAYCDSGTIHLIDESIYPNDIIAKRDKLGYKCGNCQEREIQDVIVKSAPNSDRAKEIVKEHTAEVNRYNDNAQRLNKMSGHEALKLKRNRYV